MRSIGLDVHREFCEVAISDGGRARSAGRVASTPEQLELFAQSLGPDDRVVLEATGNALAILRILERHGGEVVLAHPGQLRAISHAKVKADKVDARRLAELLAADLIPEVWVGDERTRMLRRRVSRRRGLVKQATAVKNAASAVLVRNLKRRPAVSDLFGRAVAPGLSGWSCPTTSARRSTAVCASSISWPASWRSWTRRSPRPRSRARRSAG
jgi:transposase